MKAVFSIDALAFQGDLPASIIHLEVITRDIADWGATSEVISIFHTNAGHATLHDKVIQHRAQHQDPVTPTRS